MKLRKQPAWRALVVLTLLHSSVSTASELNGAMLANTCAGCHGTFGAPSNEIIPPLVGLDSEQFIATMTAYKDGSLSGTIMNRVARAYQDSEIEAMAYYFAHTAPTKTQ